jgi:hypothetical protein
MNIGHHAIQPFVTLKGGFVDFRIDGAPATLGTFFSSVNGLRARNVNGVLYPGGGLQGHLGPIGLRLDVGDEIYFNHGAHNNLRVAPLLSVLFLGFLRICTRFTLWNPQQAFWQSATAAGTSSRKVKEKGKPPPPLEKNREGRKGRLSSFPSSKRNTATALHNPGRFFFPSFSR